MPEPLNQTLTHGTYDVQAVQECLSQEGFVEALCASMRLLSAGLLANPRTDDFAQARAALVGMDIAQDWPFGSDDGKMRAAGLLADGAHDGTDELVVEYTRLFRGPAKLPAPPWGSVYMDRDQVMYGWTWVELRTWLRTHDIAGTYEENDPEDNFARMLALASEVAQNRPELLAELLADHLLCWSDHFLELLVDAAELPTYQGLAVLSKTTLLDVQELLGIEPATRRFFR